MKLTPAQEKAEDFSGLSIFCDITRLNGILTDRVFKDIDTGAYTPEQNEDVKVLKMYIENLTQV